MGAWNSDPFGNDKACDWALDLQKSRQGFDFIRKTLEKVLTKNNGSPWTTDSEKAIAAAETVARLRGHFYVRNAYTAPLDAWVAKQPRPVPQDLVELALRAVDRIETEPSELLELWQESGDEGWEEHMQTLKERLQAPPAESES